MSRPTPARYLQDLGLTLFGRYGAKAFEALIYMAAMRTLAAETIGVVFVASASSAVAYRAIDLGLFPVMARSSARGELDRATFGFLLAKRTVLLVAIALAFLTYSLVVGSGDAWMVSAFFATNALPLAHELPRAVLLGHERFGALARLNVGMKAVEAAVACSGFLLGYGLVAWLAGRVLAHALYFLLASKLARAELVDAAEGGEKPLRRGLGLARRGIVFWMTRLLDTASARAGTFLVASTLGLSATTQLGLAGKFQAGAIAILGTMTQVAYPKLARDRSRALSLAHIGRLVVLGVAVGIALYVAAPYAVRIVAGRWDPAIAQVVRTVTPVLSLVAISRPLEVWLEAKDQEKRVLAVAAMSAAISISATFVLVRSMGIVGAGVARIVQAAAETVMTSAMVLVVVRRSPKPT